MRRRSVSATRKVDWSELGSAAVDAGDLATAKRCFAEAVRANKRDARCRFHLAIVLEALSENEAAAQNLTEALRLKPSMADAARRLAQLLSRFELPERTNLDEVGLRAALAHETVAREPIAEAALRQLLRRAPHDALVERGKSEGWLSAARSVCGRKTGPLLKDELFLAVLRTSVVRDLDAERLLTAIRRVLLFELAPERFNDRALARFAIALMHQCRANEYVWGVTGEEARMVDAQELPVDALVSGDSAAGFRLLLLSLYKPLSTLLGEGVDQAALARIRPREIGEAVAALWSQDREECARAARMPSLGRTNSTAVTSRSDADPHPRWTSVHVPRPTEVCRMLAHFFEPDQLAFLERPFEMLVAGCGSGRRAVQAALAFGPNVRVVGLDVSPANLGYASRMADRFGATNVTFVRADPDLTGIGEPQFSSRFSIIEFIAETHLTCDPFANWRALLSCLADRGLMQIELRSALPCRRSPALESDPTCPSVGCDKGALRAFRQALLARPAGDVASELSQNPDFYTLTGFRDLIYGGGVSLSEIERFLEENDLVFRGFSIGPWSFDRLKKQHPEEEWPGRLANWASAEDAHPRLFGGRYVFWCQRK
jgi:tetratricopeptide (TPR) repeat protein